MKYEIMIDQSIQNIKRQKRHAPDLPVNTRVIICGFRADGPKRLPLEWSGGEAIGSSRVAITTLVKGIAGKTTASDTDAIDQTNKSMATCDYDVIDRTNQSEATC